MAWGGCTGRLPVAAHSAALGTQPAPHAVNSGFGEVLAGPFPQLGCLGQTIVTTRSPRVSAARCPAPPWPRTLWPTPAISTSRNALAVASGVGTFPKIVVSAITSTLADWKAHRMAMASSVGCGKVTHRGSSRVHFEEVGLKDLRHSGVFWPEFGHRMLSLAILSGEEKHTFAQNLAEKSSDVFADNGRET